MLGGRFIHFASMFCQQRSSVCIECIGQRKTWGNRVPEEYFFFAAPKGYIYWVNKHDVSLSSIWKKNFSKSNPCQPFNIVRKGGEKECHWKEKARIFTVKMKYTSAEACYQLTTRAENRLAWGPLCTNSRSWGEGVSVTEALIFVDLESEKLFYSEWVITGRALRLLWISECDVVLYGTSQGRFILDIRITMKTLGSYRNIWDFIPAYNIEHLYRMSTLVGFFFPLNTSLRTTCKG